MAYFGLGFAPTFWGFMSAFAELGGGILIALGLALRPVSVLLVINMVVAMGTHFQKGDNFNVWSHAADDGIIFLALFFMGPGKYSLDALLERKR